jgi:hypothetical protein
VTEDTIRAAILEALEAYTYRLRTEFVGRKEFEAVEKESQAHGTTLKVLETEFTNFRHDFQRFAAVAEKIGWFLVTTIGGAIIFAVLGTIFL